MADHHALDRRQAFVGAFHHVVSGAAVNVDVNESRRQHSIAEVHDPRVRRGGYGITGAEGQNDSVLEHQTQRLQSAPAG